MVQDNQVLIAGEVVGGDLSSVTRELLTAGRQVADVIDGTVAVGLIGSGLEGIAIEAIAAGADNVYMVDDPLLAEYQVDLHIAALDKLCRHVSPLVFLLGRTDIGREVAPRLAFRLGTAVAQDCMEVKYDEHNKRLLANRPVYGGYAIATVTPLVRPMMACIRPKSYQPSAPDPSRKGTVEVVEVKLDPTMAKVKLVELVTEEAGGVRLEDAKVVIAGGRGLEGPEPFAQLGELAGILGAAVGASRAAVDSGWVPPTWQIGLTGKTITPDLYITVAISGASQHMAGCTGAKQIVAINKDSASNIFKEARFGVVGDWKKVLPAFTEAVRDLVKS